jgi:hypothetical protein
MTADLRAVKLKASRVARVTPADFRKDVRDLIDYCRERKEEDKRKWDFTYIQGFGRRGYPFYSGVFLLRYAFAAADHGMQEEANALVAEVLKHAPRGFSNIYDELVWQEFRPAMLAFQDGGSRGQFLATCRRLLSVYPGSRYDEQFKSLIGPMEKEAARPRPAALERDRRARSEEEWIHYWIYQLRDLAGHQFSDPGYPMLFSMGGVRPTAADYLVAFGPPAIPHLIEALEDDTPTRTIAWQRSFYPVYFVLRRQDVAMKCLERIVGCQFYDEAATFVHLHMDQPERRESAIANVREWWSKSKGTSQAEMIRNQLELRETNTTLRGYDRVRALEVLAMLEGPEKVVEEGLKLLSEDRYGLNSPVMEFLDHVDPRAPVRAVLARFWKSESREGDYTYLYKYGDRKVYAEIARRYEETGKLDPGSWTMGEQVCWAAKYGRNWAIPIVAKALERTEMTGSRYVSEAVGSQPFSNADEAMEEFQKLVDRDFGYRREGSEAERLEAIRSARAWWLDEGRTLMAAKVGEDHPPGPSHGDLLLPDDELAAKVAAIEDGDAAVRRQTIRSLGDVHTYQIQRALLNSLPRERDPAERIVILKVLQQRPKLWHLPALTELFEHDGDEPVRLFAGDVIKKVVGYKATSIWWSRLETRDVALSSARRLAREQGTPVSVRRRAAEILLAWGSFIDERLLRGLAAEPGFRGHEALHSHLVRLRKKRVPASRKPSE